MDEQELKRILTTIPLSISSSRRSGENGLQNVDEVIEALRPFLAQPVSVEVGAGAINPGMSEQRTGTVADIEDAELLRRSVKSALDPNMRRGVKHLRWTAVMRVFGLGSTYSHQLCHRFGLNPEEEVKR